MSLPPIDPAAAATGALAITNTGFPMSASKVQDCAKRLDEQLAGQPELDGIVDLSECRRVLRLETSVHIDLIHKSGELIASQRAGSRSTTVCALPNALMAEVA